MCNHIVANCPSLFKKTYWDIHRWKYTMPEFDQNNTRRGEVDVAGWSFLLIPGLNDRNSEVHYVLASTDFTWNSPQLDSFQIYSNTT